RAASGRASRSGDSARDPTVYVQAMRAAAIQFTSGADLDRNVEVAERLTRAAAGDGASLVVLPEKWPAFGTEDVIRAGAERTAAVLEWARRLATELEVDLVAGSLATPADGG